MAAVTSSKVYDFPDAVRRVLRSNSTAEGGLIGSSGLAWVFSRKELLLWMYDEGSAARVHVQSLPYPSDKKHFVSLAIHEVGPHLSVYQGVQLTE